MTIHTTIITTILAVRITADLMVEAIMAADLTEVVLAGIINFVMSRLPNDAGADYAGLFRFGFPVGGSPRRLGSVFV